MIPRAFHQIWLGPRPVPVELIEPWKAMHPRWEHTLWRETDIRVFGLHNRRAFEEYLRLGLWHGAANVARIEILDRLGGVYVDVDTVPLRAFDKGVFMRAGLFAGYANPRPEYPGLISNTYVGAEAGHPVLGTVTRLIRAQKRLVPPWKTTGVLLLTRAIHTWQRRGRADIYLAPPHVFFPEDKYGNPAEPGFGATYSRHLWGSSDASTWTYGEAVP